MSIKFSTLATRLFLVLLTFGACVGGCDAKKAVREATKAINHATDVAEAQSQGWQNTVIDLEKRTFEGLDDQRNMLLNHDLPRIIQAARDASACTLDQPGHRVAQHLSRLADALNGRTTEPFVPKVCQPDIGAIVISDIPGRRSDIRWSGFDLKEPAPDGKPLRIALERANRTRIEYEIVTPNSEYMATTDLTRIPVPIAPEFIRLVLIWGKEDLGAIALQLPPPATAITTPPPEPSKYDKAYGGDEGGDVRIQVPWPDRITRLEVWYWDYVDGIELTSATGSKQLIGGKGKDKNIHHKPINLDDDEYITGVNVEYGRYIDLVTFHTNKQSYGPYGGRPQKNKTPIQAPNGKRVVGFYGKAGDFVNSLGIVVQERR